ncbi:MAG TPA: FtsQ-type POTRA domain-containing protein [Terriglobales bacterium]|nr:FtsQ-type POTRA domain-containing protein [Terriglobales bacterium]
MARTSSSTAVQEELYPLSGVSQREAREREPFDDARLVDLEEEEQESPFLRGQKRVSVRRGSLPPKTANRLMWVVLSLVVLGILGAAGATVYRYGKHSWRFRIDSSDQIEVAGADHVAHAQIMEVMGGDIGRNIFFVPLAERKQQLEQIPWVESASVMRFVPNRLRIEIHERTPVAFARIGSHISLIDAGGTLMELAPGGKHKYSFPVIEGMNAGEPLSTRAARMKNYNELVREIDSSGARYSQELSEVDLTDPEDVKVLAADANGEVLVHLGSGNYLQRYKTYVTHVQQWRQQFDKLESVDLRYDGQIIVNPDLNGMARQAALTPAAAKTAMAAGVKTAAIVNYEKYVTHPVAPAAVKKDVKAAKTKGRPKAAHHASAKTAPVKQSAVKPAPAKPAPVKPAPVTQAALKTAVKAPPAAVAKSTVASHPAVSSPAPAVPAGQKKPSAGIPKETQQN